jgi:cell division transport system permease protein
MTLTVREALLSFKRAPILSVLSITTIAFALFVVSLVGLVGLNLRRALEQVEERVEIVMYLRRGVPIEVVTTAMGDIQTFPEVAAVTHVTEEEALRRARTELQEFQGVFEDLETNPLPASLEISLRQGFRDSENMERVATRLSGFRFAEDIRFGRDWVAKLDRLRDIAGAVGLLVVLQRSREINIMRLVGATDQFIRSPFLLEGSIKGALGGLTAVGLSWAAFAVVSRLILEGQFFSASQAGLIVLFGTALGFLASAVSVGRHLRRV